MTTRYDDIVVTRGEATHEVNVHGTGPWAISLALILEADYTAPLRFALIDGETWCWVGSERFLVTGFDPTAAALVLDRPFCPICGGFLTASDDHLGCRADLAHDMEGDR